MFVEHEINLEHLRKGDVLFFILDIDYTIRYYLWYVDYGDNGFRLNPWNRILWEILFTS